MKSTFERRTREALAIVVLVPMALGAISFYALQKSRHGTVWVAHTREVLADVDQLLLAITRAESQQRGFLLTGESAFLTRFEKAKSDIADELQSLRQLIQDNPIQREHLRHLTALLQEREEKLNEVLRLQHPGSAATPANLQAMHEGTEVMRSIWNTSRAMKAQETGLLIEREQAQHKVEGELIVSFLVGILANMALLYWCWRMMRQYGTERDRAESSLRQLNVELEQRVAERTSTLQETNQNLTRSNEDLARFAYVASHDLQEPLRSIASYAGLLSRRYGGKLDDQADRYIKFMIDGAKRMQFLVQGLLAYSRIGTQALNFDWTDMNLVLADAKQDLRLSLIEHRATIYAENLPKVLADRGKLTQVLENLIANAVKFSKASEDPIVWIEVKQVGKEWLFSVRDNGVGFDPEYAEKVFVMFQRLHPVGAYPGAGMGLAISKRIIEGHGGRIWAEAKIGEGATFFFTLPDKVLEAAGKTEASQVHESTSPDPRR